MDTNGEEKVKTDEKKEFEKKMMEEMEHQIKFWFSMNRKQRRLFARKNGIKMSDIPRMKKERADEISRKAGYIKKKK